MPIYFFHTCYCPHLHLGRLPSCRDFLAVPCGPSPPAFPFLCLFLCHSCCLCTPACTSAFYSLPTFLCLPPPSPTTTCCPGTLHPSTWTPACIHVLLPHTYLYLSFIHATTTFYHTVSSLPACSLLCLFSCQVLSSPQDIPVHFDAAHIFTLPSPGLLRFGFYLTTTTHTVLPHRLPHLPPGSLRLPPGRTAAHMTFVPARAPPRVAAHLVSCVVRSAGSAAWIPTDIRISRGGFCAALSVRRAYHLSCCCIHAPFSTCGCTVLALVPTWFFSPPAHRGCTCQPLPA